MTIVAPPSAPFRRAGGDDHEALIREARERQRRRRWGLGLSLLGLVGAGGIGYGIDRGVSSGQPAPVCVGDACARVSAVASRLAPTIVSVFAEPGNIGLSSKPVVIVPGKQTKGLAVVPASPLLRFKVILRNSGTTPDTNLAVTLTVYRSLAALAGTALLRPGDYKVVSAETRAADTIGPNQTEVVTVAPHARVPIAEATKVTVSVTTAASGKVTAERAENYPVIFSLP